ncbi:hypothetical protein MITSMUL_05612 [Mitsuokella multacida DSM 20544]|uniref:Uncharacterized protein n=1 Tax=Mitsuokella multacida DSM 20544 TaxID=500635 RepID=C9KQX3_9FIRM|nr:hypothetical protein MITSMUL_05612 [Mitsuokella multacida DSM 20544]
MTYLVLIVADCSISIPLVFCGNLTKIYVFLRLFVLKETF